MTRRAALGAVSAPRVFAAYLRKHIFVRRSIQIGSISTASTIAMYDKHDGDLYRELVFYAGGGL